MIYNQHLHPEWNAGVFYSSEKMKHEMKEKEWISVIVSAYNSERFLVRCLESILAQTYRNLEIIVVDDGSTDKTSAIADNYALLDERIKVIHQKNKGLAAAREKGIELSNGRYIGFVDSDDVIEPDMYERLLCNLIEYDADISQCDTLRCSEEGKVIEHQDTGGLVIYEGLDGLRALLQNRIRRSLCNKLYKSSIFIDPCPDTSIDNNENLLRNYKLFGRSGRCVSENYPVYHYCRRSDSMSMIKTAEMGRQMISARRYILEDASDEIRNEALECYAVGLLNAWDLVKADKKDEADAVRNECIQELKRIRNLHEFEMLPEKIQLNVRLFLVTPGLYEAAKTGHIRAKLRK